MLLYLWRFLHILFAFSFVGALTHAEWNGRAARATTDWGRRAALWGSVRQTSLVLGLGSLVLLGILGNVLAVARGLSMGGAWMGQVNGLWLVGVLLFILLGLPSVQRLAAVSEEAAKGGDPKAYPATLNRYRLSYGLLGIFYMAMLALMVLRPLTDR